MLKTIKKAFLLSSFFYSLVLPMRQVAQVALTRTLNKSASLNNSLAARYSVITSVAILAKKIERKAMFLEDIVSELLGPDQNDFKNNENRCRVHHDLKNGQSWIFMNGGDWQGPSEQEAFPRGGSYRSGPTNVRGSSQLVSTEFTGSSSNGVVHHGSLSGCSPEQVQLVSKLKNDFIQQVNLESIKEQLLDRITNYRTIVQDKTAELVKSCSLSWPQELLVKKSDFANRLLNAENKLLPLMQNPNVKFIVEETKPSLIGASIPDCNKSKWTPEDHCEVYQALGLMSDIE